MAKVWKVKCNEELNPFEIFKGIVVGNFLNSKGEIVQGFVGVTEIWETATKCIHRNVDIVFYQEEIN